MTDPAEAGGFVLASLDAVDDLVAKYDAGTLEPEDRSLSGSHPFVLLVESALESISTATLKTSIAGLSRASEARLVEERRKLEGRNEKPALQGLLFTFESASALVRESGYGSGDPDANRHFFSELFPDWLDALSKWAEESDFRDLLARVAGAIQLYAPAADDIAE